MPLPESFLEPKTTLDEEEDYVLQKPFTPDGLLDVPPQYLDTDLNIPAGSLIKKRTFITTIWTTVPEVVMQNAETGCVLYKVGFQCTETTREFLVVGALEILVREKETAWYSLFKYINHCPGREPVVTPWTEAPALSIDRDTNLAIEAERLVLNREGILQYPPEWKTDSSTSAPVNPDMPFFKPPAIYGRPFVEHGYNDRITEGDFIVLRQTVWLLQYPVVVKDCYLSAVYVAAVITTKWHRETKRPVLGFPQTDVLNPLITQQLSFKIPGCEKTEKTTERNRH